MSLFPKDVFAEILILRSKLEDHNYAVDRVGLTFTAEDFKDSILARTRTIQSVAERLERRVQRLGSNP